VRCSGAPFCKWVSKRKYTSAHEKKCPSVREECPKCDTMVIRKILDSHSCTRNLKLRVVGIRKCQEAIDRRLYELNKRNEKFEFVLSVMKKKLMT
jgi:hypothetical protein